MRTNYRLILLVVGIILLLWYCTSSSKKTAQRSPTASPQRTAYASSPVDRLIRDLSNERSYSIILHDMELDESKNLYRHKYRITKNLADSTSKPTITDWTAVDEAFFAQNLDNMGLELASKTPDGKVHKIPSPPGFNGYVGNTQYGTWKQDNHGNKFWEYYGQYAFMSHMLGSTQPRVYQTHYDHYSSYRSNPSTSYKPYYGNKEQQYGTHSPETRKSNPSFFERKQQQQQFSSFKQKVDANPRRYTRAERNPTTTYSRANKTTPTYTENNSRSASKPSTSSSSSKSSTSSSSSKPSTTSSTRSSSASKPSYSSSSSSKPSSSYSSRPSTSSSSRSSSSSSSRSSSSSSSRSSSPSRRR